MRVLHVIPSLDARDGGPSVALPLMARSLVMQGMTVDVATTMSTEDAQKQGIRFGEPVEHEGFTVRYFKRQTVFYKVSLPLLRWLKDHVREYALVHNHAVFSFAPLAGAWVARRRRVPYLMRPLGLLNRWGMENRRRWVKALSFRLLDRPALNGAAAIHYTSKDEEREAERLSLRSRSVVAPLGIDPGPIHDMPDAELFYTRFPTARGKHIVLFLSRLDPKKGIDLLLEAFADVRRDDAAAFLVVAGSGAPDYKARLKARAAALCLDADMLWTGFLDGDEKLAALRAATVFVLPSRSENFGIALLEAMAAGSACIATEGVAIAEDMRRCDAGLVIPCGDAPALAAAMVRLMTDDALRARIGTSAARLAADRFSIQAMGTALAQLYGSIIAPSASR